YWDAQDVLLADVDRIEVISGPGGTTWGVNAVNGVINIITRSAADTQGTFATAGASSEERIGAARYGGTLDNGGHYRVYGKYIARDDTELSNGRSGFDGWHRSQAGFRADWGGGASRSTLQGDAYQGWLHQFGTSDIRIAGANLLGRVHGTRDNGSTYRLQGYWDHTERDQPNAFREHLDTFDLDAQNTFGLGRRQEFTWGGGLRYAMDRVENDQAFAFLPGAQNLYWANVFAQDEIRLLDTLRLTAGLKLERNNYTGVESLPTLRLSWEPTPNHVLWAAASRAARAPSRIDRDFFAPTSPPVVNGVPQYAFNGGPNFMSETLRSLEAGYRGQLGDALTYSFTAFYNRYEDLRTLQLNPSGPGAVFTNQAEGSSRGIESWATWQAAQNWRLSAGLVAQHIDVHAKPGPVVLNAGALAANDPSAYWSLRSAWDITSRHQLDVTLRHVAALPNPSVPAYTEIDMRLGWKIDRNLDLDLIGQNLLHPTHVEYDAATARSEYPRTVFVRLAWRY
ncbi:MAG: TonB-dependent receptor plug domain-containing protein, partial [Burkholderiaceae bacterium]